AGHVDVGGVEEVATRGAVGVEHREGLLAARGPAEDVAAEVEAEDVEVGAGDQRHRAPESRDRAASADRFAVPASCGRRNPRHLAVQTFADRRKSIGFRYAYLCEAPGVPPAVNKRSRAARDSERLNR